MARTCLLHALQLHHKNSHQMDTSGQEKEGTTKRDMAVHRGERPQYQWTESQHGPRSAADQARWRTLAVASRDRRCREDELVGEITIAKFGKMKRSHVCHFKMRIKTNLKVQQFNHCAHNRTHAFVL